MQQFDIKINYPKDFQYHPQAVCLKLYPYDGKRYQPEKIVDFLSSDNNSEWSIDPVRCVTNAVYVIETHSHQE